MGLENLILEGDGLCLMTVRLDGEAADRVRQAAAQAKAGVVTAFPDYPETLLNGHSVSLLKSAGALICLIDFDKDKDLAVQAASALQSFATCPTTLIALSVEESPDLILHAMRAGCTEYLTKPLQVEGLAALLRKLKERWQSTVLRTAQSNGRTLGFMAVCGGAGATTIAVHVASSLARQRQKTLIVDQHPCLGHVALWFGMDGHSYSLYDLLQNISRLDQTLLKSYVAHHSSGTDVLASPDLLSESVDIEREVLGRAIRFVAGVYDFVVIDCPAGLNEPNLVTADGCDEFYLTATQDVPALRDLARYIGRLRELQMPPAKLRVVINQYGVDRPVTLAQIEKAIDHPVALTLPSDAASLTRALDAGQPIAPEQKSEFGNQIKKWVAELAPAVETRVEKKHKFAFWM